MIEHDWFTSAQNHHLSLKKSIAPLVTHSTFLISAGIGPFCMKSEWEIGHIESSYSGRQRTFPPATAGDLAKRSKSSIFDSLFYAEKGPSSCMC